VSHMVVPAAVCGACGTRGVSPLAACFASCHSPVAPPARVTPPHQGAGPAVPVRVSCAPRVPPASASGTGACCAASPPPPSTPLRTHPHTHTLPPTPTLAALAGTGFAPSPAPCPTTSGPGRQRATTAPRRQRPASTWTSPPSARRRSTPQWTGARRSASRAAAQGLVSSPQWRHERGWGPHFGNGRRATTCRCR